MDPVANTAGILYWLTVCYRLIGFNSGTFAGSTVKGDEPPRDGPRVLCVNLLLHLPIGVTFVLGVAYFCWIIIVWPTVVEYMTW